MNTHPKEFYRTYLADDNLSALSTELLTLIRHEQPVHVLEFGGGTGKNIGALEGIEGVSLDISFLNVAKAHFHNNLRLQILGDEGMLRHLCNFDVVFTLSVLDHIEDVAAILGEFKRIANKAVYLAEATTHQPEQFYYKHDYTKAGFERLPFSWTGQDGHEYGIWRYRLTNTPKSSVNDDLG